MYRTAGRRFIVAAACVSVLMCLACTMQEGMQGARTAENRGQYDEALMAYASVLSQAVERRALPDRNRASAATPEQFLENVALFLDWMRAPGKAVDSVVTRAAEGIARCSSKVEQMTFPTQPVVRDLALADYRECWHDAYYPEFAAFHDSQVPLMAKAFEDGFSFVRVSSRKSYSYEGLLVEQRTWRATAFSLYYESNAVLPARPGRYLLLVQGKTQFASGSTWTTPWAAIAVEVPGRPSLVALTLNTSTRKK